MPEILEVEEARRLIDAKALGRRIATVHAPDAWYLKRGLTPRGVRAALPGLRFSAARRRGKLLLLDTDDGRGPTVGLHLGMSGRVLVDAEEAGDPLVYASNRDVHEWRRFAVDFDDGGRLALRDPRRLGAVELDPDEDRLGVDAFDLTLAELRSIVSRSRAPLKAVLMDQSRIAGLGNLAGRRVPVARGSRPDASGRLARCRRASPTAPFHPDHLAGPRATGRFTHRRPDAGAPSGWPLPATEQRSSVDR